MAALRDTFVITIIAITIKRVHGPKGAKRNCNASCRLGRGGKRYDSQYCDVLAWGDASDLREVQLRVSSLIS